MNRVAGLLQSILRSGLLFGISLYQSFGRNHVSGACRFEPSCSEYAVAAAKEHRPLAALRLIFRRLLRCRPGGPFGFDPVPPVSLQEPAPIDFSCQSCHGGVSR